MSKAELDMADALFEAVRLQTDGDVFGAGLHALPAIEHDAVMACGFLTNLLAHAVHQYAAVTHQTPAAAFDSLWSKPSRNARGGAA